MKWNTPITIKEQKGYLQHGMPMLFMGSCFAENVGEYLTKAKFDITVNPFGTLYNPESIATALQRLMSGRDFEADELQNSNGLWYSYHHHGRFSQYSPEAALQEINEAFGKASSMMGPCRRLIVTWGTAYVYRLKESGMTVANCHKQPASLFTRHRLTVDEIVASWRELLKRLFDHAPQCEVLFTVSPIRHLSDGAHDNQLSKSTLLLAADALCREFPERCSYFPAYEIVLDELRDYRFYADDMTHPSSQAVAYVCERLSNTYFTPQTQALVEQCLKIERSMGHRPLNGTDNDAYRQFAGKLIEQMRSVEQCTPAISYAREISEIEKLISQHR